MTAIVGVLNKHGVALAADSAVTFGNTHKVVNTGNKVFALSKYYPVTVATYGISSFMGVPWDIILKLYRKQLQRQSFLTLKEYVLDLIQFLHNNDFFSDETTKHQYLQENIRDFYNKISVQAKAEKGYSEESALDFFEKRLKICVEDNIISTVLCPEFSDYDYESFISYSSADFQVIFKEQKLICSNESKDLFCKAYYYYLRIALFTRDASGLIVAGYGESEIYPSLFSIVLTFGLDGRLHYYWTEQAIIKEHGTVASVIPFAQIDVAQTIIRGVNPSFYEVIAQTFKESIGGLVSLIAGIIKSVDLEASKTIKKLNTEAISQEFIAKTQSQFKQRYTDALLNTIVGLDKEDMSNMAESFVSLTSLVRRMSPGEETVGGPVDVVFVSKCDGLIWMKRKHYFDPSLNTHFFANYYRDDNEQ